MASLIGQSVDALDTPQALLDLDVIDANLRRLNKGIGERPVDIRVHFKSLKCTGLARYLATLGVKSFLCAKLNEAEALADAGLTDLFVANQIVGPIKLRRLVDLARRAEVRVCVDDAANIKSMSQAAKEADVTLGVLVEVDTGMNRCGVEPGLAALELARLIQTSPGLRFMGLQGYDGHLQMIADPSERKGKCLEGLAKLIATRRLLESEGIPVEIVTGGGTGTWEYVANYEGVTEIQPGSFLLMDCAYHSVRPEFGCSLSILTTVVSRRPSWYVLDAGSKAISRDFGMPVVKNLAADRIDRLSEEHARVLSESPLSVGQHVEVLPAHCCATMNLHRQCVATRKGRIEAIWPIEASGRYD